MQVIPNGPGSLGASQMEGDMKRADSEHSFNKIVAKLFYDNGWKVFNVTPTNIGDFEVDLQGKPIVAEGNKMRYRSSVASLLLEAYGARAWEFHGKIDVKSKYGMTNEHYEFITTYIDVNQAVQKHSLQYNGEAKPDPQTGIIQPSATVYDEVKIAQVDNKQADDNYRNMLNTNIKRLEIELSKSVSDKERSSINDSITKMKRILDTLPK